MNLSNLTKTGIISILFIINNSICFAQFGGGAGTAAAPYEIYTIEHLMELSDSVKNSPSNNATTNYNWSRGKYFMLKNDITDSVRFTIGWPQQTGGYVNCFQGNFNGNNKTVTLALAGKQKLINGVWEIVSYNFVGLFSGAYLAIIHNLNTIGIVRGEFMVGGICGYAEYINISNCINWCSVVNSRAYNTSTIGGICGGIGESIVSNCVNYGRIESYSDMSGGIAGSMSGCNITNCINHGSITSLNSYVGGICGIGESYTSKLISNCHNYGNVSGKHAVGGIMGCLQTGSYSSLSHCTNTCTITAISAVGGIVGHSHDKIEITHCINIGTVQGDSVVGGIASGYDNHFEDHNGSINNCHNSGLVIGNNIVGGIQGRCWGEIRNSLNSGVVIGNTNTGGIAGETNNTAIIQNCHYDEQMCIHGGIAGKDATGQAEGYLTKELIGNNLQAKLSNTDWTYNNANLYPTLKHFEKDSIAIVASSPVYLYDSDVADFDRQNRVSTDFKVNLENDVKWNRIIGNVDIINEDGLLLSNGSDTLVASIGNYKKLVPINIQLQPIGDVKFTIWATEHKQVAPTSSNYHIPIYIKSNAKTLRAVTIKKLILEIDRDIFYAKHSDNGTLASKNQNEITIENITIPALNAGEEVVLFNLIGDVLLGNIDSSEIIIDQNVEFAGDFNSSPEVTNGYITLNICREGSDRFIGIASNSPSIIIKNNPVEDVLKVECYIVESGKYTLEVVDMAGRSVNVEEFVAGGAGLLSFEIDSKQFGIGSYILTMKTPSKAHSIMFTIVK